MRSPSAPTMMYLWPKAKPVSMDSELISVLANSETVAEKHADPTHQYTSICKAYEEAVSSAQITLGRPGLLKHQLGRGTSTGQKACGTTFASMQTIQDTWREPSCQVASPSLQLKTMVCPIAKAH